MEYKNIIIDGEEVEVAIKLAPDYYEDFKSDELEDTKELQAINEEEHE